MASIRFHKRFKILPGVYLNISKTGISLSLGIPGLTTNLSTKRGVSYSVGMPGTGLSMRGKAKDLLKKTPKTKPVSVEEQQ